MRTQCPFCENEDPEKSELCFVEDRAYERAEMCHQCKRYLVGIDLRKYPYDFIPEVAVVGTMYLDILAQEKGFLPMADSAWTLVPHLDISSERIQVKRPKFLSEEQVCCKKMRLPDGSMSICRSG